MLLRIAGGYVPGVEELGIGWCGEIGKCLGPWYDAFCVKNVFLVLVDCLHLIKFDHRCFVDH